MVVGRAKRKGLGTKQVHAAEKWETKRSKEGGDPVYLREERGQERRRLLLHLKKMAFRRGVEKMRGGKGGCGRKGQGAEGENSSKVNL